MIVSSIYDGHVGYGPGCKSLFAFIQSLVLYFKENLLGYFIELYSCKLANLSTSFCAFPFCIILTLSNKFFLYDIIPPHVV